MLYSELGPRDQNPAVLLYTHIVSQPPIPITLFQLTFRSYIRVESESYKCRNIFKNRTKPVRRYFISRYTKRISKFTKKAVKIIRQAKIVGA